MSDKKRESDKSPTHGDVDHSPVDISHIGADHGGKDYERRDVNANAILISTVIGVILIIASLIGVTEYFIAQREEQYAASVLIPPSSALRDVRAQEAEVLNSYKVLDAGKGIYQIPIRVAMERLAEEAYQKSLKSANAKK